MKKVFLKNNSVLQFINVMKVEVVQFETYIIYYDLEDRLKKVCSIENRSGILTLNFIDKPMPYYLISAINEYVENFNQYNNFINQ